jgi:hypothetical protein
MQRNMNVKLYIRRRKLWFRTGNAVGHPWDLNIQPHSPDISLYEPAICKPEDGLQVGRNMSLFH